MGIIATAHYEKVGEVSYMKLTLKDGKVHLVDSDVVVDAAEALNDINAGELDEMLLYPSDTAKNVAAWDEAHPNAVQIYPE